MTFNEIIHCALQIEGDTKKTGTFENPTKIEEIQEKKNIDRN